MYEIKQYDKDDAEEIFAIYRAVWDETESANVRKDWEWKYEKNPNNPSSGAPLWVAKLAEKTVGLIASMPAEIKCGNSVLKGSFGADVMVDPSHRHRGVAKLLLDSWLQSSSEKGIPVFLAFPNRNSEPVIRRLGWDYLTSVSIVVKPLNINRIIRASPTLLFEGRIGKFLKKLSRMPPKLNSILSRHTTATELSNAQTEEVEIFQVQRFDESVNEFWGRASEWFDFIAVRDSKFLNWRFTERPDKKYSILLAQESGKILGYIVFRVARRSPLNVGMIADLLVDPSHKPDLIIRLLLLNAYRKMKEEDASLAYAMVPLEGFYMRALRKNGFIPTLTRPLMGTVTRQELRNKLGNVRNWYFSGADADNEIYNWREG